MQQKVRPSLVNLSVGKSATVHALEIEAHACKLMALGIEPGVNLSVVRKSPFGQSLYVSVGRHFIALRKSEAEGIILQEI